MAAWLVALVGESSTSPSIALLDREASRRWEDKREAVLAWEDSPRLSDYEVGIREYAKRQKQGQKGTGGMLKASWSDFRVVEVSADTMRPVQLSQASHPGPQPPGHGYLKFVMAKIGYDTISAVGRMCTWLDIPRDAVAFAGIKDKSAVTCQALTIDCRSTEVDVHRLRNISKWIPRLMVGQFEWTRDRLATHAGNYFTVLLRDIDDEGARRAKKRVKSVCRRGFINYYGHQRFGLAMRSSMPTIEVGKALLLGKWDDAVALVMSTKFVSHPAELAAKHGFSESWVHTNHQPMHVRREQIRRMAAEALAKMPAHCFGEISMLRALSENKTARQCLFAMPHRAMYMLAYWSALWNRIASRRIQVFGARHAVEGDLVCPVPGGTVYGAADGSMNVTIVTKANAKRRKYGIHDVVLPLPGRDVELVLPKNAVGCYIVNLLKKEGVHDLVCGVGAGQAPPRRPPPHGRQCLFRHMVAVPDSLEHALLPYTHDDELIVCDDPHGGRFASLAPPRLPPLLACRPSPSACKGKRRHGEGDKARQQSATRTSEETTKTNKKAPAPAFPEGPEGANGRWALQLRFGLVK